MNFGKNPQHDFPKMRGGGQRPFGTFPNIHPFLKGQASLSFGCHLFGGNSVSAIFFFFCNYILDNFKNAQNFKTQICWAKTYPSTTSSYCFAILLDSEQKLQQYDTLVTLNTNTLSFIANQIINFK